MHCAPLYFLVILYIAYVLNLILLLFVVDCWLNRFFLLSKSVFFFPENCLALLFLFVLLVNTFKCIFLIKKI